MGRIIIKVKFQKTMKKKMMTILFLVSSSAIGACNNANKVDAVKKLHENELIVWNKILLRLKMSEVPCMDLRLYHRSFGFLFHRKRFKI